MRLPKIFRLRLRSLFARNEVERELEEELQYHLEREIERYIAVGMSPESARRQALWAVGPIPRIKEDCRDMQGLNWIDNALQDFRYAIRQLQKSPGFTCTTIFVLALGISAAVSISSLVEAALIKPLPYRDQSHLVSAFESGPSNFQLPLPYLDFIDWKRLNTVFSSIDGYALNGGFSLSTDAGAPATADAIASKAQIRTAHPRRRSATRAPCTSGTRR